MAKQKGTKTFEIEVGTLVVTVECDEDGGYDGTKLELEEAVRATLIEDIESITTDGDGWTATDVSTKVMM